MGLFMFMIFNLSKKIMLISTLRSVGKMNWQIPLKMGYCYVNDWSFYNQTLLILHALNKKSGG